MAFKGKELKNPATGQEIRFLKTAKDTGGQWLEMESTYNSRSKEPTPHYHPFQDETFTVSEGELSVKMNGTLRIYRAGKQFQVPKGTVHCMWNDSPGRTVMHWQVRPAMQTEYLLETTSGLAMDGRTDADGKPGLLQIALIANRFAGVFRLTKPPYIIQRILFTLLTPLDWLAGYKATYRKYID